MANLFGNGIAIGFLIVVDVVFRVGDNFLRLNAFDDRLDQSVSQERVFAGEVLKVAAIA